MHNWLFRTGILGFAVLLFTGAALGAEGGSSNPLDHADPWQAVFTIVVFVLLLLVLSKVAFRPILDALNRREQTIREALEQARRDREEAEARMKEYERKLTEARGEAAAIVDEARRDAEVMRRKVEETARVEAAAMVERGRREIGIAKETAIKELYTLGSRLATTAAARIIRKELNPADHERLIGETIDELAALK